MMGNQKMAELHHAGHIVNKYLTALRQSEALLIISQKTLLCRLLRST